MDLSRKQRSPNKALHLTAIPLRSIAAGELIRYADDGAHRMNLKHIAELLNGEGSVTLGAIGPVGCAAVASDGNNCLAMLVRYAGESLEDLLTRLDEAIRAAVEDEVLTDEING